MRLKSFAMACAILALSVQASAYQIPAAPHATPDENVALLQKISKGVATVAKEANKAVVFISVYKNIQGMPMGQVDPFEFFFGPRGPGGGADPRDPRGQPDPRDPRGGGGGGGHRERREGGLGSGFFIDLKQGYLITNNHVVQNADEIQLKLANGDTHEGKVVGRDPNTDIAVVQVKTPNFNKDGLGELALANSDQVSVGDFVVALGAPFGLEASLSFGVVSAIGRGSLDIAKLGNFIQTDAAINPGNSGGPLLDMKGQVVGLNTAIYSRSGAYNGIGFSVPANLVRSIAENLVNDGSIQRGFLGVELQPIDDEMHQSLNLPTGIKGGALVARVTDGSPAAKAGVEPGDVITGVNGQSQRDVGAVMNAIGLTKPGSKVDLDTYRDGKKRTASATLTRHPQDQEIAAQAKGGRDNGGDDRGTATNSFGMQLSTLTPQLKQRYNLESKAGVLVARIQPDSAADNSGFRPGDLILKVDGKKVDSADEFAKLAKGKARMLVWIERAGEFYFVTLRSK